MTDMAQKRSDARNELAIKLFPIKKRLAETMMKFVERAAEKDATPEEVKALPEVAKVMYMLFD